MISPTHPSPASLTANTSETTAIINKFLKSKIESASFPSDSLLQLSGLSGLLKGPAHKIEFVNPVYSQAMKVNNISGKTMLEVFPDAQEIGYIKVLDEVISSGKTFTVNEIDFRIKTDNGGLSEVYLNVVHQPYTNNQGLIEGVLFFAVDVTEQVITKKNSEENNKRQKQIVDHLQEGVWIFNKIDQTTFINPKMCDMLGCSKNEMLNKNIYSFLNDESKKKIKQSIKLAKEGSSATIEIYFTTRSEKLICTQVVLKPVFNDAKNYQGCICLVINISEQKKAENNFQQSDRWFKALIEKSNDMKMLSTGSGKIIYASPAVTKVLGYTNEELLQSSSVEMIHPDDLGALMEKIGDLIQSPGKTIHSEHRLKHKNGHWIWCEGTMTNMLNEPWVHALVSNFRDITERKINEQKLHNSEVFNKSVLNSLSSHIAVVDKSGKIIAVNETWNRFAKENGHSSVEKSGIGSNYFEICKNAVSAGENSVQDVFKWINDVLSGKILSFSYEYPCHSPTEKRWFNMNVVKFENDEPMVVIAHDNITERKLAEEYKQQAIQRYEYVTKATFDAVWDWDLIGDTIFYGEGFHSIFGYDLNEMKTEINSWINGIHPDDRGQVVESCYNIIKSDINNWECEYRFLKKTDNTYAYVLDRGIVIRDAKGLALRMVGAMQDLTEKKKLQNLLDKANRLARLGSWELDLTKPSLFWSDMIKEIHDVPADYIPELSTAINFYKEGTSRDTITKVIANTIATGNRWDVESLIITAKGNEKWIRSMGQVKIENGKPVMLYGSVQDIDARKKGELALFRMLEEKNEILESINEAFYAIDNNWIVTYWNKKAESFTGISKEQIIGKKIWEQYPEFSETGLHKIFEKAMKENVARHFENFSESKGLWQEISAFPSKNGLSVYFKDITQRKIIELRLEYTNMDRLKHIKEVEKQYKNLRDIAWAQSHTVRAPLARIMGLVNLLRNHKMSPKDVESTLDYITSSAEEFDMIIKDIISKAEKTKKYLG